MKLVLINTGGQLQKESKEVDLVNNEKENADVDSSSMFYQPNQYYVKPYHVMRNEYYSDEMDRIAFENTNKIAEECNVDISHDDRMIFPMPYSDPYSVLENKVMAWHSQYTKDFSEEDKKIYKDRLIEELTIYDKMDFSSYPLVLEEIINHANSKGILTGPGRGSAAGSLISYALGLTKIDPIPYGLMFSRYLSAGRAKYPLIEFDGYPLSEWNKKNE